MELLFRYKARYFPEALSSDEELLWIEQVREKFFSVAPTGGGDALESQESGFDRYYLELLSRLDSGPSEQETSILHQLRDWAEQLRMEYSAEL